MCSSYLIIKLHLNKEFFLHRTVPDNIDFSVIIISVGTPLSERLDGRPNLDILSRCIEDVAKIITQDNLLILRSTVPVGTAREVEAEVLRRTRLPYLNISFCPERTAEGSALIELKSLPQVVSGNSQYAINLCREFFREMVDEIVEADSLEEAELTKLFNNVYRDSIFALSNIFSNIAQDFGLDGKRVIKNANHNYPRCNIPLPGFVAGPCLEKDAYILASNLRSKILRDTVLVAREVNERIESDFADWLSNELSKNSQGKVLVTGLAFKGNPPTNDLRGSSTIKILKKVELYKNRIMCHDMMNARSDLESSIDFQCLDTEFYNVNHDFQFDLVLIMKNHIAYKSDLFKGFISKQRAYGARIFDAWDVLELVDSITLTNYRVQT